MDFEKSSFVKLIGDNHGDLDPLKRATELLLKTIVKKKFYKGDLKIFEKFKIRKIIEDLEVDKEGNEEKAAKAQATLDAAKAKVDAAAAAAAAAPQGDAPTA